MPLPAANLGLRGLYDSTVEFFALRSPVSPSPADSEQDSRSLTPVPDPLARLTQQCASLRERLNQTDSRTTACACRKPSTPGITFALMRRELEETKKDLAKFKLEVVRLDERCRKLEIMLAETRDLLRARDVEIQRLKGGQPTMTTHIHSTDSTAAPTFHRQHDPGFPSPVQEAEAKQRASESFMTRVDTWSGAQVLQAAQDLNSEILQLSAAATELCVFRKAASPTSKLAQAMQDTTSRMGQQVTNVLSSRDHSQDPILVQLLIQGGIANCVARSFSAFCMGFPHKHDAVLTQIYSHIYIAGKYLALSSTPSHELSAPQPTSARWRSLTHRHIHSMYPYLADYAVNDLAESIFRWTSDIYLIAGCSQSDPHSLATRDGMRSRFGEQVRHIAKAAFKLSQLVREEIMSTNFDVTVVNCGHPFEGQGMKDAFGDYGASKGAILATTELGLRCATRKDRTTQDGAGEVEARILLTPKVVLESVVDLVDPR